MVHPRALQRVSVAVTIDRVPRTSAYFRREAAAHLWKEAQTAAVVYSPATKFEPAALTVVTCAATQYCRLCLMSDPSDFLLENLALIERIASSICRRRGMAPAEIEEFSAIIKLKLVEDDYAIIKAFRGRSSFATYIAAVITRLLLDYRDREWGKWRVSAEAERLGDRAVELERLLYRDCLPHGEALDVLVRKYPGADRAELERFAARLRPRVRRRMVGLDDATQAEQTQKTPDLAAAETAKRTSTIVNQFIQQLPPDDQLLLRLHFDSGMKVAEIARSLQLDAQSLHRRLYRMFAQLRVELQRGGVSKEDVNVLIDTDTQFLDFQLKKREVRPSPENESTVAGPGEEESHDP